MASGSTTTQRPDRVMPMPMTSKRFRSSTPTTPAAVRQDTACSLLAPPNTTAIRARGDAGARVVAGASVTIPDLNG
jgi:hypothetical protein